MGIVRGRDLGNEICEALGIDAKKATMLNIHIPANGIVTVIAKMNTFEDEGKKLVKVLKKYRLEDGRD